MTLAREASWLEKLLRAALRPRRPKRQQLDVLPLYMLSDMTAMLHTSLGDIGPIEFDAAKFEADGLTFLLDIQPEVHMRIEACTIRIGSRMKFLREGPAFDPAELVPGDTFRLAYKLSWDQWQVSETNHT